MSEERLDGLKAALREFLTEPRINGTHDEFHGYEETHCGLWMSGEDGNLLDSGLPAFSYGAESEDYDFGIHMDVGVLLDRHDAHAEWHDPGTVMIYLD